MKTSWWKKVDQLGDGVEILGAIFIFVIVGLIGIYFITDGIPWIWNAVDQNEGRGALIGSFIGASIGFLGLIYVARITIMHERELSDEKRLSNEIDRAGFLFACADSALHDFRRFHRFIAKPYDGNSLTPKSKWQTINLKFKKNTYEWSGDKDLLIGLDRRIVMRAQAFQKANEDFIEFISEINRMYELGVFATHKKNLELSFDEERETRMLNDLMAQANELATEAQEFLIKLYDEIYIVYGEKLDFD
ncbi:hypothetical protein J0X12_13285 [Sneathiella sp. CAU 1612]|uniref:DUF3137 domain-containing protein n=1 Tax=Sneathiella sedimenti TaxID=2816034 RepID=A0ABS3F7V1_9PROT|nr:hypothetical protein [Sneathiella sedimenti]MBO0334596.1 hypothetical protein [Sneathiella sedimenti]